MTDAQVVKYTELSARMAWIYTHSGVSWKPEYGPELEQIKQELSELGQIMETELAAREAASQHRDKDG